MFFLKEGICIQFGISFKSRKPWGEGKRKYEWTGREVEGEKQYLTFCASIPEPSLWLIVTYWHSNMSPLFWCPPLSFFSSSSVPSPFHFSSALFKEIESVQHKGARGRCPNKVAGSFPPNHSVTVAVWKLNIWHLPFGYKHPMHPSLLNCRHLLEVVWVAWSGCAWQVSVNHVTI